VEIKLHVLLKRHLSINVLVFYGIMQNSDKNNANIIKSHKVQHNKEVNKLV